MVINLYFIKFIQKINCLLLVKYKKKQIQIALLQAFQWKDPRIRVNKTHPYWKGNTSQVKKIRLNGDFVDECLWTPKLKFIGTLEMSLWNPHSTSTSTSKLQTYLKSDSFVRISSIDMKLTISCNMKFGNYPFDRQVSIFCNYEQYCTCF